MNTKTIVALSAAAVALALPSIAGANMTDGKTAYEAPPAASGLRVSPFAGSWNPISGTAYSNGNWFTSSNVRTVHSGAGSIKVSFNTLPKGGLSFYAKNYNTGLRIGSIVYAPPLTTQTLGSAAGGTPFVNVFKLTNTGKGTPYNFDGSEFY